MDEICFYDLMLIGILILLIIDVYCYFFDFYYYVSIGLEHEFGVIYRIPFLLVVGVFVWFYRWKRFKVISGEV